VRDEIRCTRDCYHGAPYAGSVPAEIEPPELARIVDFAERPRAEEWSLRAALVRYAQPEPQRVNDILELVRRLDAVLGKQSKALERNGEQLWDALEGAQPPDEELAHLVDLLRVAQELDRLGDRLATWAVDIRGPAPDAEVDATIAEVAPRLDALGVPREERPPGPRNRG
jgi:hypothetical protein